MEISFALSMFKGVKMSAIWSKVYTGNLRREWLSEVLLKLKGLMPCNLLKRIFAPAKTEVSLVHLLIAICTPTTHPLHDHHLPIANPNTHVSVLGLGVLSLGVWQVWVCGSSGCEMAMGVCKCVWWVLEVKLVPDISARWYIDNGARSHSIARLVH